MVELMSPRQMRAHQRAREDEVAFMLNSIYQKCNTQEDIIAVKAPLHVMVLNTISSMVLKKRLIGDADQSDQRSAGRGRSFHWHG